MDISCFPKSRGELISAIFAQFPQFSVFFSSSAIFPHELDGRQNDLRLHFTKVMHRFLLFSFHFDAFFPPARCFAKFQRSFSLKPLELSHDGSTWTDSELLFSQERAIQKIILK